MKFAYADPPYYKHGKRLYSELHSEAAIWDQKETHLNLIQRLYEDYSDGFALSASPTDLAWILPQYPELRVCVWAKTFHQILAVTTQYAWEPVLLHGGRKVRTRKPFVRDWMSCTIAKKKGYPGAKPEAFNNWILDLLNYQPGDTLDDLFPGTGGMGVAVELRNAV